MAIRFVDIFDPDQEPQRIQQVQRIFRSYSGEACDEYGERIAALLRDPDGDPLPFLRRLIQLHLTEELNEPVRGDHLAPHSELDPLRRRRKYFDTRLAKATKDALAELVLYQY
jgi:hypothetical protein